MELNTEPMTVSHMDLVIGPLVRKKICNQTSSTDLVSVCSTIASSVTNVSLIWDLWKTPNFAKSGKPGRIHTKRVLGPDALDR